MPTRQRERRNELGLLLLCFLACFTRISNYSYQEKDIDLFNNAVFLQSARMASACLLVMTGLLLHAQRKGKLRFLETQKQTCWKELTLVKYSGAVFSLQCI